MRHTLQLSSGILSKCAFVGIGLVISTLAVLFLGQYHVGTSIYGTPTAIESNSISIANTRTARYPCSNEMKDMNEIDDTTRMKEWKNIHMSTHDEGMKKIRKFDFQFKHDIDETERYNMDINSSRCNCGATGSPVMMFKYNFGFCLIPKNAITMWILVLNRMMEFDYQIKNLHQIWGFYKANRVANLLSNLILTLIRKRMTKNNYINKYNIDNIEYLFQRYPLLTKKLSIHNGTQQQQMIPMTPMMMRQILKSI